MYKTRKASFVEEKFTLFPFLDALSGVVGVLALVISALSLLANDKPKLAFDMPINNTDKQPHYVECVDGAVIIHPEKTAVNTEEIQNNAAVWNEFLDTVQRNNGNEYVVLLLRMDGLESYNEAIKSIRNHSIEVGREIVTLDGEIEINAVQ